MSKTDVDVCDCAMQQGQPRLPSGSNQPQMRSKLIQQLTDMGFKVRHLKCVGASGHLSKIEIFH